MSKPTLGKVPDKGATKVKASVNRLSMLWRRVFLASEPFAIPTYTPYEASLQRLLQALKDDVRFTYLERVAPEDHNSAQFEIRLYEEDAGTWRKVAIARGRMVSQPAFGDAFLQGEVFNGWWSQVRSYLLLLFGGAWSVYELTVLTQGTDDITSTVCGGLLGLMFLFAGLMYLLDLPLRRRKMLDALAAIFPAPQTPDDN